MGAAGDDFDIDDLLEAPYQPKKEKEDGSWSDSGGKDVEGGDDKKKSSKRSRSKSKERQESKDKEKDRKKKSRSRSREKSRRSSDGRSESRSDGRRRDDDRARDRYRDDRRDDRGNDRGNDRGGGRRMECYTCHEPGHKASECPRRDEKIECYTCHGTGHKSAVCPRKDDRGGGGDQRRRSRSRSGPREVVRRSRDGVTTISLLSDRDRELDDEHISQEERDARTVFIMQLSKNVTLRDIKEFFDKVGSVRDVRLISDRNSKRSKGIGYVEFTNQMAVPAAIKISGQKLLGVPIMVSPTMAEKNRHAAAQAAMVKPQGPMRLYIGSLHSNITEVMLQAIFEPFGTVESVQLQYDKETAQSKGYGFVTFKDAAAGRRALEQMNGFELAGRSMKVSTVVERGDGSMSYLDVEETEKGGIEMNAQSRASLMQKLAAGSMPVPSATAVAGTLNTPLLSAPTGAAAGPPASPCLILKNLFDPRSETEPTWAQDYRNDVLDELKKFGIVVHINVDTISPEGNIYVKALTTDVASKIIQSFNGRWFAGRTISAMAVPALNYHTMFADSMSAVRPLKAES